MKKMFLVAVMIAMMFMVSAVYAAEVSVSKSFPSRVDPNGVLTVTFTISPGELISGFDLAELIPEGWTVSNWDVSGYQKSHVTQETRTQSYGGNTYAAYHWKFGNEFSSPVTFTYTLNVPVSSGDYGFVSIWTYPGGFSSDSKTLSVAEAPTVVCGDGTCNGDETYQTCPSDCPAPAPTVVCGDDTCEGDETYETCPADCPAPAQPTETSGVIVGIVIIIIIVLVIWLYYHYKKTPKHHGHHYF